MSETNKMEGLCVHCLQQRNSTMRYVACIATSKYNVIYPLESGREETTWDDIKIWKLNLCDSCITEGYKLFLNKKRTGLISILVCCSLALIYSLFHIGIFGKYDSFIGSIFGKPDFMYGLDIMIIIGSPVGIVASLIGIYVNYIRRRNMAESGFVPDKRQKYSFIETGEIAIKYLEKGEPAEIKSLDLHLPEFKEIDDDQIKKMKAIGQSES